VLIEEISVQDLHALGTDVTLIDVREADEWEFARVGHARHIPLSTVPDHLDAFSGEPTYVMCKVGGRSLRACEYAAAHGKQVVNVTGGILAWLAADYDVDRGSDV